MSLRQVTQLLCAAILLSVLLFPSAILGDTLRVATFHTELSRKGPGLLVQALREGTDPQILAVLDAIRIVDADVIALQGIDWDYSGVAVAEIQDLLAAGGLTYLHAFSAQPNSGAPTGLDVDADGWLGGPADSHGWGRFKGQGGMVLLSKLPIRREEVQDYSTLRWVDFPDARLPSTADGTPFFSADVTEVLRLSSTSHWVIPVVLPNADTLQLLVFHAAPPVFDGAEDRNGLRNADELRLATIMIEGSPEFADGRAVVQPPFVVTAAANLDPTQGEGRKSAIRALLERPELQDPQPRDEHGDTHTVHWDGVGKMRVDYVLPSSDLVVKDAGILRNLGSRHGVVWVDIATPDHR